jgi:GT2 family glycosyltransferase
MAQAASACQAAGCRAASQAWSIQREKSTVIPKGRSESQFGVVVVSYRSANRVRHFVKEELSRIAPDAPVVIVNVGDTPDASRAIADQIGASLFGDATEANGPADDGNLHVLHVSENVGYARGNNLGARFLADRYRIEWMLLSNDDVEISVDQSDIVRNLLRVASEMPEVAVIGPRVLGPGGRDQSPHCHRSIHWLITLPQLLLPLYELLDRAIGLRPMVANAESGPYYRLAGCFMLVNAEAFFLAGAFDENTFLYGEELILSARLSSIGRTVYFDGSCHVLHDAGSTTRLHYNLVGTSRVVEASLLHYFAQYEPATRADLKIAALSFSVSRTIWLPLMRAARKLLGRGRS